MNLQMEAAKLEPGICLICGSAQGVIEQQLDSQFHLKRCPRCSIGFLDPRLREESILKLYQSNDYFFDPNSQGYRVSYEIERKALAKTARGILRKLRPFHQGGRMLEIGCGTGIFLEAARPYFSFLAATDYSAAAVEKAKVFADQLVQGGLQELPATEPFDVIVLNQVIEHLYQPKQFLEQLKSRLSPKGLIVVTTPYFDSFWYSILGRRWPSFKTPEHVSFFNPAGLESLARHSGLRIKYLGPHPHYFSLASILTKLGIGKGAAWADFPFLLPRTSLMLVAEAENRPLESP